MASSEPPEGVQPPVRTLKPHRGTAVLVLGILALVTLGCYGIPGLVLGIIAWVMGNTDLREMNQGIKDLSGRGLVVAGRICAIIATGLIAAILTIILIIASYYYIRPGGVSRMSYPQRMEQRARQLRYANEREMWEHGGPWQQKKGPEQEQGGGPEQQQPPERQREEPGH